MGKQEKPIDLWDGILNSGSRRLSEKITEALSQVLGRRDPTGQDRGGFFSLVYAE